MTEYYYKTRSVEHYRQTMKCLLALGFKFHGHETNLDFIVDKYAYAKTLRISIKDKSLCGFEDASGKPVIKWQICSQESGTSYYCEKHLIDRRKQNRKGNEKRTFLKDNEFRKKVFSRWETPKVYTNE